MPQTSIQAEAAPPASKDQRDRLLVLAITLLAALLRLLYLGHKSLWLDEAVSVSIARLDWAAFRETLWHREGNMALYYLLLRPVVAWGQSEWQVRLLSAVAGIATVPVMFALGARLFGRRAGLFAALLFAVNACSVVYSQEARGYSLAVLLVASSTLVFVRLVRSPSWIVGIAYAILAALSIYAHFFSVLVVAAQWLSVMFLPARSAPVRKLTGALVLTAFLSFPAAAFVLSKNVGQLNWVPKPSLLEFYHLGLFLSAEGGKVIGNILFVLFVIALCLAGKKAVQVWRAGPSPESWSYALALSCLITPIVLTLIISLRTPVFFHRFLIVCLPAFLLLAAIGLSLMRLPVIALFVAVSMVASIFSYSRTREQWREATQSVLSQAKSGDQITFFEPWGRVPFNYYIEQGRSAPFREVQPDELENNGGRIWAVIYPLPPADIATGAMEARWDARFPNHSVREFRGLRVVLYEAGGR